MQRDNALLYDMLESAELAATYLQGITKEDFQNGVQLQDAVIRRIEIIGEAAARLSEATKMSFPTLPWQDMTDMRNFLIHQYGDVDSDIVWDTVKHDLPLLIAELKRTVDSE
ncbi:MAG: DUF86 domain-containing protein [Chloroflexi bacterium]|nr:DUF86 domain-containing protein [Chloroflexota bacterium]